MHTNELLSLACAVGASSLDVLYIARLVAGDESLLSIDDLTPAGADEVASYLRTLAASDYWLDLVLKS